MSYVRFSSDGWKSDVYVYEHVDGGFVIHVAQSRKIGLDTIPSPPNISDYKDMAKFAKEISEFHALAGDLPLEKIGGVFDGQSFYVDTVAECIAKLEEIQSAGYHVPEHCMFLLQEEMNEEKAESG